MVAAAQTQDSYTDAVSNTDTSPQKTKPDLYTYILSLLDQLAPVEQLQIVAHIVTTIQPMVDIPPDDEDDDDEDEEELLNEAIEALEYARAHPESLHKWEDVKAELMQMEVLGELPD